MTTNLAAVQQFHEIEMALEDDTHAAGWNHFTNWCIEHRCAGLPSAAAYVGRYIEHLVETEVRH